ncbi:MAG: hypothetical protein J2P38_09625 [Candidatus Dormibacteraeota bacterium]|nr:hypothetical protein [Candidatus Dormibacteraeota bacterium]
MPGAVSQDGSRAYGLAIDPATGDQSIGAVDLRTGTLTRLVDVPATSSGLISMVVDDRWLAWVQGDSVSLPQAWTIHALGLATGEQLTLATSELPDGSLLFGQQPLLAIRGGVVSWAQPTSTDGPIATAEVRAYDLDAGRVSVLDSGRVSSPVIAGPLMVWGRIDSDGKTVLRAVDAATYRPVELPEQLRTQPGIIYLAGSSRYLVWSTDWHQLVAWRMDTGLVTTYTIAPTGDVLQFLSIAGHFMIWFAGSHYAVLDLRTGGAFDAATHGGLIDLLVGSTTAIVRIEPQPGPSKGPGGSTVFSLRTAAAPGIPGPAR